MIQADSKRVIAFLTPLVTHSPFVLGLLLAAASAANEKVDQMQTNKATTRASLTCGNALTLAVADIALLCPFAVL